MFLRNSPLASRLVPPESLANPRFSRFLPSHPALSRVSQLSCLFTIPPLPPAGAAAGPPGTHKTPQPAKQKPQRGKPQRGGKEGTHRKGEAKKGRRGKKKRPRKRATRKGDGAERNTSKTTSSGSPRGAGGGYQLRTRPQTPPPPASWKPGARGQGGGGGLGGERGTKSPRRGDGDLRKRKHNWKDGGVKFSPPHCSLPIHGIMKALNC